MFFKKSIWFFVLLCCMCLTSLHGQSSEIGIKAGAATYMGDLAYNSSIFGISDINLSAGLYYNKTFSKVVAIETNINYCKLSASDINGSESWRPIRNLSFETHLLEANMQLLLSPINFHFGRFGPVLKFYGGIGMGIFQYNPYTYFNDQKIHLQNWGTEGQGIVGYGEKYALLQINIPLSLGVKLDLSEGLTIGIEASVKKLFTDYLDDVSGKYVNASLLAATNGEYAVYLSDRSPDLRFTSTEPDAEMSRRGDPTSLDSYAHLCVRIGYRFSGYGSGYRSLPCPTF